MNPSARWTARKKSGCVRHFPGGRRGSRSSSRTNRHTSPGLTGSGRSREGYSMTVAGCRQRSVNWDHAPAVVKNLIAKEEDPGKYLAGRPAGGGMQDIRLRAGAAALLSLAAFMSISGAAVVFIWWLFFSRPLQVLKKMRMVIPAIILIAILRFNSGTYRWWRHLLLPAHDRDHPDRGMGIFRVPAG